ncbi:MAG: patatin-like phospholipase family protein [Firmicutes bacterium]|nr:patatin-like phospholipase family protein [Bacillota bacterium]
MNQLGLVLAGGGGKGAYQIGVWKALRRFGIDKNVAVISGNSVGGLNAALFMAGAYETAERIWLNIEPGQILHPVPAQLIKAVVACTLSRISPIVLSSVLPSLLADGIFSRDGLLEIIDSEVDLFGVSNSRLVGYVSCCPINNLSSVEYIRLNGLDPELIKKYLLATSAIPGIFPVETINNITYCDGGTRGYIYQKGSKEGFDNVPLLPLYNEGCNFGIIVHLSATSIIQKDRFPDMEILEIFPSESLGGLMNGTLDFSAEGAKRRMRIGYEDTIRVLEPFYDTIKTLSTVRWSNEQIRKELVQTSEEVKGYLEESRAALEQTLNNLQKIGRENDVQG